jgi:uncharacterized protein (TIRG00374 family)
MYRFWLKLALSTGLLFWLLARTPLSALAQNMTRLSAITLLGGAVLSFMAWWLSALRLWCVAPEFRLTELTRMTFIGMYYGTVLPGQAAGDLVKAYRLSHTQRFPGHALAATLVDRGVAMLALFAIGAVAALTDDAIPAGLRMLLLCATGGLLLAGWLLSLTRVRDQLIILGRIESSRRWIARGLSLLERIAHALHDALRRPRRIVACLALAMVFHALCVGIHVILGHALGIRIGIGAWCLVYAGVSVLMLLPLSVAGIGLREGGYVGLLALFGVSREVALALSLTFFCYTLIGALVGFVVEVTTNTRGGPPASETRFAKELV